jgi:hypothetical protein
MTTVISDDRVSRFAELDHAVLEEVQAIVETGAAESQDSAMRSAVRRLLTTLRASVRLPQRS